MTLYDVPDDDRLVSLKLEDGPCANRTLEEMKYGEMIDVEIVTNTNYTNFAIGRFVTVDFHFLRSNEFVHSRTWWT